LTGQADTLVARHRLALFFVLAYAISWPLFVLADVTKVAWITVPGLFGPAIAAVIVALASGGLPALQMLLGRLLIWCISPLWFGFALVFPAATYVVASALAPATSRSPTFSPSRQWYLIPLVYVGLYLLVIGEELGWRGFALPVLQRRWSALLASPHSLRRETSSTARTHGRGRSPCSGRPRFNRWCATAYGLQASAPTSRTTSRKRAEVVPAAATATAAGRRLTPACRPTAQGEPAQCGAGLRRASARPLRPPSRRRWARAARKPRPPRPRTIPMDRLHRARRTCAGRRPLPASQPPQPKSVAALSYRWER
jgi:hypothetical protein